MFTGLVTAVGDLQSVREAGGGRVLRLSAAWPDLVPGESVAVNGACLTVERTGEGWFEVHAVATTLGRTTIGDWQPGRRVHLERALAVGDRLGGHWVQGHVDAVGEVLGVEQREDTRLVAVSLPATVAEVTVPLGSIAVDGVSLTVHDLPAPGVAQVALVPHTLQATVLGNLVPGDRVHLEGDILGKYVRHLMAPQLGAAASPQPGMP